MKMARRRCKLNYVAFMSTVLDHIRLSPDVMKATVPLPRRYEPFVSIEPLQLGLNAAFFVAWVSVSSHRLAR
jgi:hypothetical protein